MDANNPSFVTLTFPYGGSGDLKQRIFDTLRDQGISITAACGGHGVCGKCKIRFVSGAAEPSKADLKFFTEADLADGWRLLCTADAAADTKSDIVVEVPASGESKLAVLTYFKPTDYNINRIQAEEVPLPRTAEPFASKASAGRNLRVPLNVLQSFLMPVKEKLDSVHVYSDERGIVHISPAHAAVYGIAIDIGTTTITMALINLETGIIEAQHSAVNKQREFGADVISRIQRAASGGLDLLSATVRGQISAGVNELLKGRDKNAVVRIAIAANTTMLHLLMGLSCDTLGAYPFTPVTLDLVTFPYSELFSGGLSCDVDVLPGLSTYVGADITAGILFTELHKSEKPQFLLDIGTNGEMAVCANSKIYCTATAAGPAFEGGNISCGTGSVPGAISSVRYKNGLFSYDTIGGQPPTGICGSGVIDVVFEAYKAGLIDRSGRFSRSKGITELLLASSPQGQDIKFIQKDVRELQLGKSAIRSGIDALLTFAGLEYGDIDTLYIAGGFGFRINFESGVGIGLIPEALKDRISLIGNSSLGGAIKYLLDKNTGAELDVILKATDEFNLGEDKLFNKLFVSNINFI